MDHHQTAELHEPVEGVELAQLSSGELMSVQYFRIAPGASVPMHSHRHEQAGYVFDGALTFVLEDESEVAVSAGDSYTFQGNESHAAENRGENPVVGIDVFSPPRTDPPWADE